MSESRCAIYNVCPYSKPFFVGSDPRFRYSEYGYLPSLCGDCPDYRPILIQNVIERRTITTENITDGEFRKLRALVTHLQEKVNLLTDKKSRSKYD